MTSFCHNLNRHASRVTFFVGRIGRQLQLGVVFTVADEEFVLLYEACRPSNLPYPHSANAKFSLVNKDPAEGKADFRVEKRDIPVLFDVFYYATSKEYLLIWFML